MTKLSKKKLDPAKFGHYINNLWSVFTLMDKKEDVRLLFKDLFTHTEYKMFAKRLEIARRLLEGENYESIEKSLNVTSRTITNISNILAEKGNGLRLAHDRLSNLEEKYLKRRQGMTRNLENPFIRKAKRKTLGGALLKAGVKALDKSISRGLRKRSARKKLVV